MSYSLDIKSGADQGWFLRFDVINLLYLLYVFRKTGLSKQWRPRSAADAAECGIWSGYTLFATQIAILHTFIGSKMDLFKRSTCIRKRVWDLSIVGEYDILNLSNLSKLP